MLPNRLPVELLRALETRSAPAYRVDSAGPDGVVLTAAGYPSIHLFGRGDDLVARCAGAEHSAPLWSLDHLAAVLMPSLAAPLPDIGGNLRKELRKIKRRLKPPAPVVPLTAEQQAAVEQLRPVAIGIAQKMAGIVTKDRIAAALVHLADAVQAWDGRGSLRPFVCERVEKRLIDDIRKDKPRAKAFRLDPRRIKRGVTARHPQGVYRESPSHRMELAEAATTARRCLTAEEVHALKLNLAGLTSEEVARREHFSERKARYLLANARRAVRDAAKTSGLPAKEIAIVLLACQDEIRARALRLLGE